MGDNLDFYERVLREPPAAEKLVIAVVVLSAVLGSVSAVVVFSSFGLSPDLEGMLIASIFFYLLPAVLTAEIFSWVTGVTRRWTYLMVIVDQVVVFMFSGLVLFTESVNEAWQVMWLALGTVYLVNIVMLVMARGRRWFVLNFVYPLLYPAWLLFVFHVFIGRLIGVQKILYIRNSVLFLLSAFLFVLTLGLFEFVARANVQGIAIMDFFSTLLLNEEQAVDQGISADVYHQAFQVDNGRTLTFNIPWVHPGPIEGFGGGRLTSELIDEDNFFLHVPSYHSLDLARPEDIDLFRDIPALTVHEKATRLFHNQEAGFDVWGRRYGDTYMIFLQNHGIDDYEPSLIYDLKERFPDLCLIDLHNQPVNVDATRLQALHQDAAVLKTLVAEMMDTLENASLHPYSAGFAGNTEYRCLVETVDGQRTGSPEENGARTPSLEDDGVQTTCLLGVDGNGAPSVLHEVEASLDYDEVLVFTTDSHEELLELARPRHYDAAELKAAVRAAEKDVAPATAGFGEHMVNVQVLGTEYEGLIATLNVMGRLVPITLLLYFVAVMFLVL